MSASNNRDVSEAPSSHSGTGASQSDQGRPARHITRRRGACQRCQARQVRCDGKTACDQCQVRKAACFTLHIPGLGSYSAPASSSSDTTLVSPTAHALLSSTTLFFPDHAADFGEFQVGKKIQHCAAEKVRQSDLIKDALLQDVKNWRGPQSEDFVQAFARVLCAEVNIYPSSPLAHGAHPNEGPGATVVRRDFALECVSACLKEPHGCSTFLTRGSLETSVSEIMESTPCPSPRDAFGHVILALGSHILQHAEESCNRGHGNSECDASVQFHAALRFKARVLDSEFSLRNFQALTMIVLDEDFIDYQPPKLESQSSPSTPDWLLLRVQYATLCVSVLKTLFGQRILQNPNPNALFDLDAQLQDWVQCLPVPLSADITGDDRQKLDLSATNTPEQRTRLYMFLAYHEAVLTIHTRRRAPAQGTDRDSPGKDPWLLGSDLMSASSVRSVLAAGCEFTTSHVRLYPNLYRLMSIATCSLAASTIRNPGDRTDLSYLATAAGFFGRMALAGIDGPFEEITELVRVRSSV